MTITNPQAPARIAPLDLDKLLVIVDWYHPAYNHGGKLIGVDVTLTIVNGPNSPRQVVGRIYEVQLTQQIISGVRQGRVERDGFHWVLDEPWDAELAAFNEHATLAG